MKKTLIALATIIAAGLGANASAQVTANAPWVRGTVPQQTASGAFMQLTSKSEARLVDARSPLAARVEIHEMKMEGDVMRMRSVDRLTVRAGEMLELKPGGYHLMLIGLKKQLKDGDEVPLALVFETDGGPRQTVELKAPVRGLGSGAGGHAGKH